MLLLGSLLLVAVSCMCAERDYFYKPGPDTWDNARLQCQACYKDLTTITPTNAEFLGWNLTSDYWIGLRQIINGSKLWSRWANGEPVLYQNWYPGHPVPKKKSDPQPTCQTPLAKTEVMQCPAFAKLCTCLNSSEDDNDDLILQASMFNTTMNNTDFGMMPCPALAKLCACLHSYEDNEMSIPKSTTNAASPTPTMVVSTSTSNDLEPEYIEDFCVALLSFGMWQEIPCNESLPYICYDDRFNGDVEIKNVTEKGGILSWSEAGTNVSLYRVKISGNLIENVTNETSYQIESLLPGTLYKVQVIPVKCDRDLNAQNLSFYTLPEKIRILIIVTVESNVIRLSWKESSGTNVSYLVNVKPGNSNTTSSSANCSIINLQPGQLYSFTVKAVVNETIFGEQDSITACTKPSKVKNLTSSNNDSDTIIAEWDSSDINSLQYSYKIILDNMIYIQNGTKSINLTSLTPGTNHTLTVSAIEPYCSEEGEAASIRAYTTPNSVSNLQLQSTNDSITANWDRPYGSYSYFKVIICSSMSENISFPSNITKNLNYTFTSLKTAALYNVSVTTYVKEDLNPSKTVTHSIYTRPNSPGEARVQILNSTAVYLNWTIPENSQGVKDIAYSVKYVSDFWQHTGSLRLYGNTNVIISELKSGSKYKFNVTVWAGELESLPSETMGLTNPEMRNLTLAMLCSSSTQLYCMNATTMQDVLTKMNHLIQDEFKDDVFWNLSLKDRN